MKKQVNVAVIGCGYWGPNLIRNFRRLPEAKVKCVCDIKKKRLTWVKSLYPSMGITTNYRRLIKDKQIDAIVIATPPFTHYYLAKECLKEDKHVLVEKPLTLNSRDAETLIKLARKKKRIIMAGHTYLYAPGIRKLKEIISEGKLGKILYINSVRVNLGLFQKKINVILDLGPHDISIINYLLEKTPLAVSATGSSHYHKGIEDISFLTLYYSNNLIAHMHLSWIDPMKIRRITVVGDKEMAVYDDLNTEEPLKIFQRKVDKIPYYKTYGEFKMLYRFGDIISPRVEPLEPLNLECKHFIECILNRNQPLTSAKNALEVVRVLELANKSLKYRGKIVKLK